MRNLTHGPAHAANVRTHHPMTPDLHRTALEDLLASRLVMAVSLQPPGADSSRAAWWMTRSWCREPHHGYPDYETLWPQFAEDLQALTETFTQGGRPAPLVSECELSYVNPVTAVEPWPGQSRLERLLLRWFGQHDGGGLLPSPEDVVADARFSMPRQGDAPAGTMTIETRWLSVEGPGQVMGMTLSARSRVSDGQLTSVRAFFDNALEWIIRGFAELTTASAVGAPEPTALQRKG
jgi:hypothetical protein